MTDQISNRISEQVGGQVGGQIGENFNVLTKEVITSLQYYIIILIVCLGVFILINLITCGLVIVTTKTVKKIEKKTNYL